MSAALGAGLGAFIGLISGTIVGATLARRERDREAAGGTILFAQALTAVAGAAIGGSIGANSTLQPPNSAPPGVLGPPPKTLKSNA